MAILPNSRPSTGWRRGDLTNNCIKEISMSAKLRYSRTATIKLWRQHLGAQLPGTLPQPLNVRRHQEQCSRHKTIGTIPRYPRVPKKIWVKFEERTVKTSTSGDLTRATKGLRSKKNPTLRYIYNSKTQNSFLLDSTTAKLHDQSRGLLRSVEALIPTCHAQDATLS